MDFKNDFSNSTNIFSGKILSRENIIDQTKDKLFNSSVKYRIEVKDNWKGNLKQLSQTNNS